MRRLAIAAALVLAGFNSANAEPYSCAILQTQISPSQLEISVKRAQECINEQKTLLERSRLAIERAWKLAQRPSDIFGHVDLGVLRRGDTPIAARFQRLHHSLREHLYPMYDSENDAFVVLRSKYSDPSELRSLYASSKHSIGGMILTFAIKGMVTDVLAESAVLFEQPLGLVAASAGNWYFYECGNPQSLEHEHSRRECQKVSSFSVRFKETYGVDPTPNTAYVLSWLYRRHLEGGPRLVAEWQRIAKDFSKENGIEPARPQVQ